MKVGFLASDKRREKILGRAFIEGVERCGDEGAVLRRGDDADGFDVVCMVGVKSLDDWVAHRARHRVMIDKGYSRHRIPNSRDWEFWRVAVNAHHPTRYLMDAAHGPDRFRSLGLEVKPWRHGGGHILIAGSSAKYHRFYGLPEPTAYARQLVAKIRQHTDRPIVYRPKPSWREAEPVDGAAWSGPSEPVSAALKGAWAIVTNGSNACFEAALMGVPSIVLGDAVARPISSTRLDEIEKPRLACPTVRDRWFENLSYCQWTLDEFASGRAWANTRGQIQ